MLRPSWIRVSPKKRTEMFTRRRKQIHKGHSVNPNVKPRFCPQDKSLKYQVHAEKYYVILRKAILHSFVSVK